MTLLGAVLVIPSASAQANNPVVVDRVVAVVNDEIITMSDLQREAARNPGGKLDDRSLLEEMINRKLQLTAAKRTGMDVTDKELNEAVADIMKRNGLDEKQFQAALAKEGLTLEQYRAELRDQIALSRVFNKFVRSGIAVEEEEIRAYYERNRRDFALPEEFRVRQIFFKLPADALPSPVSAAWEKARSVADRAKNGEDFITLVRTYSEGETVSRDGDLGFLERDTALPEIEQATRALKPGEIAGPFACAGGLHVIRLEEVRTPVKPLAKVHDEIANIIYQQKTEHTYRSWLQGLRSESTIENRL